MNICASYLKKTLPVLRQPVVLVLFLDFPAELIFRTNGAVACDNNLLEHEKESVPKPIGKAHVFIPHGGEFLKFVLPVVNMNLENAVGLLLDFVPPLSPTQR